MRKIVILILIFTVSIANSQRSFKEQALPFCKGAFNEMSPSFYKGGIVFSSNEPKRIITVNSQENSSSHYNLYYAEKNGGKWGRPQPFSTALRSPLNESSATFSKDGGEIYFTQSYHSKTKLSDLQKKDTIKNGIFIATYNGKEWVAAGEFPYNDEDYNFSFPFITSQGDKLFFCSDMPGGLGGYDIYYCERKNGEWQKPVNMGNVINTAENDVTPFYHNSERLYFASRGHHNRADLDIYYSDLIDGEWMTPIPLPRPINGRRTDDFAYIISEKMDTGYFVSNRESGIDDIYAFTSTFPSFQDCPVQLEETFCYEFYEAGSMDLDTTNLQYEWDFGDGTKTRNVMAEHCYSKVGKYIVSLNVIDSLTGDIYFSEATYELLVEPVEQPYILALDTVFTNEKIALSAEKSEIKSFEPKKYFWDLGDGNIQFGTNVDYTYKKAGIYYIKLGILAEDKGRGAKKVDYSQRACAKKQITVVRKPTD